MLISAHGSLVPWLFFCMWSRGKNSLVNGLFQFHVVSKQQLARDIELQRELKGPSKLREICMSVSVSMRWHTNACVSQIERSVCTDRGLWVKVTKVSNFNVSVANVEVQPYIIFWWVEWEKKKCKSFYGIHKNLYTRFKSDRLIQINSITSVTNCMLHVCWHSMMYLCFTLKNSIKIAGIAYISVSIPFLVTWNNCGRLRLTLLMKANKIHLWDDFSQSVPGWVLEVTLVMTLR